jgi:hypothetical protein
VWGRHHSVHICDRNHRRSSLLLFEDASRALLYLAAEFTWSWLPGMWTWMTGIAGPVFWTALIFWSRRSSRGEALPRDVAGRSLNATWLGGFSRLATEGSCLSWNESIKYRSVCLWETNHGLGPSLKVLITKGVVFWFVCGPETKIWAICRTALPAFTESLDILDNLILDVVFLSK